jgi:hypothetical protein
MKKKSTKKTPNKSPQEAGALVPSMGSSGSLTILLANLRAVRAFPNLDALRLNLSWTHYRSLLRVDSATPRLWYMDEAVSLQETTGTTT